LSLLDQRNRRRRRNHNMMTALDGERIVVEPLSVQPCGENFLTAANGALFRQRFPFRLIGYGPEDFETCASKSERRFGYRGGG
jgi:hypothetical protein